MKRSLHGGDNSSSAKIAALQGAPAPAPATKGSTAVATPVATPAAAPGAVPASAPVSYAPTAAAASSSSTTSSGAPPPVAPLSVTAPQSTNTPSPVTAASTTAAAAAAAAATPAPSAAPHPVTPPPVAPLTGSSTAPPRAGPQMSSSLSPSPSIASHAASASPAPISPSGGGAPRPPRDPLLDQDISEDKEVYTLLRREAVRQANWLNLIASENYAPKAVMQAEGSVMMNKYSEGYPGMRHYGGNEAIDLMEQLCQERALQLYELDPAKWGVNVQSLAGTQANSQVYHALMKPHERLMGLSLTHGGHMSFGYQTDKLKVSCVSAYYDTLPYEVDLSSGRIDYDDLEKLAKRFRPKVIVAGASSYCRLINYYRLKSICTTVGAYLVVDMAHIAGQIAARLLPSPFEYADVVTTAAQKTLRGPRGALIFFKKELEGPINFSVFPASQGGPHNHTITALAVALGQANTRDFREYQRRLMSNAKSLENTLVKHGFSLVSGGTDIHMVVVSLVDKGIDGARVNAACERSHIALSATAVPGDKWALPRAVRIGTTAMTTRGFTESDFVRVVELLDKIISISVKVQAALPESANKLRDFKAALSARPEFDDIKREVSEWVTRLPLPESWC